MESKITTSSAVLKQEPRPIPFILHDEDSGRFTVSTEAMALLERTGSKKKLAVIAIAGPYRSGKSFLANRFVGKMRGF